MSLPPRSALYMPASSARMLAKGPSLGADAILADLEDAVAPEAKATARVAAVEAFGGLDYGHRLRVLRVNGADTPWHADDVAAVAEARPDAVLLPKVGSADDLARFADALDAADVADTVRVWAMLETLASTLALPGLARAAEPGTGTPRLAAFCVGGNDLAFEAGLPVPTARATLLPWLMGFLAAARGAGAAILDGVWNDHADTAGFARDCAASAASGMDGRTLVHPAQIEIANRAFSPNASEIEDARRTVDAFADPAAAGRGAIALDGRMLERLHLEMAHRTLARARRAGAVAANRTTTTDPGAAPAAANPPPAATDTDTD